MLRFGFPTKILHDQGRKFENKLFHRLEQLSGVTRLRTTPYHPQGNGKVERFNRTLLGTLPESQKHKWKDSHNKVVHAYNSSRSDATGFSPFYLLFGRSPRLPVDLMFGLSHEDTRLSHAEYTEKWKVAMQDAYDLARQNISKSADDGKRQYDRKVRFSSLQPGDRVLVCNLSERGGPGKLRSGWEQEVQIIVEKRGDLPVYEATPEGRKENLEYSTEISCYLVISCKVICQNLPHNVPKGREGQFLLPKEVMFTSMMVTVGMGGSYLASQPPVWKFCQHQLPKHPISTLSTTATNANVSVYLPSLPVTPYEL